MRVLQSGIYDNFLSNQKSVKSELDKTTREISSGKKIENPYEDNEIYVDTMRLDSQIDSLKNIQDRVKKSRYITNTTDSTLSNMNDSLRYIKTKLVQASNGTLNSSNLKSLAIEIKAQKDNLVRLANTSINGEFIFSGTAVNTKTIDEDGNYMGNDKALKVELSNGVSVDYSIDGASLFFGVDKDQKKSIVSNVKLLNRDPDANNAIIKSSDTIEDMMQEGKGSYEFKLKGVLHDGKRVNETISLSSSDTLSSLIDKIADAYGRDNVSVKLNSDGFIELKDLKAGASKLDFQLKSDSFNFNKSSNKLALSGVDDSAYFDKSKNKLSSNIALFGDGAVANGATKLSEISNTTMDGKSFEMRLTDIKGVDRVVKIDLNDNSSFSIDGKSYTIFDANLDENSSTPTPTKADDFTISQLQGIISLAMSSTLPSSNTKSMIDSAISDAKESVEVTLDHNGKLNIKDLTNSGSDIKFSLFDSDINNPSISFMGNHAVVSNDPQFDMFKDLDEIIDALEESIKEPGSDLKHLKNITIEDSIAKIEVLSNHINDKQTQVGSIEKSLDFEEQKASTLELNTQEIKSNIADIDIAQTAIKYQQLSLNYQAMMSTIAKVNSLSLLNYLR